MGFIFCSDSRLIILCCSRQLYKELFQSSLPELQPPNWTRSRIRRRHLVSLGIPVNLDEVLGPHANGRPLPALQISTRPLSAPPGPRALGRMTSPPPSQPGSSRPMSRPGSRPNSRPASQSRSGTPKPSPLARASTYAQLGLGPRPEINEEEIKELLDIDEGRGPSIVDYFRAEIDINRLAQASPTSRTTNSSFTDPVLDSRYLCPACTSSAAARCPPA